MLIQDTEVLATMPSSIASFLSNAIQKNKTALDLSQRQADDLIQKVLKEFPDSNLIPLSSLYLADAFFAAVKHRVYFKETDGVIDMCVATPNAELMRDLEYSAINNTAARAILESDLVLSTDEFKQMLAIEAITGDNNAPSYPHMLAFAELFDIRYLREYDPAGKIGGLVYETVIEVDQEIAQKMHLPSFSNHYESTIIARDTESALQIFANHLPTDLGLSKNGFWYAADDEMVKLGRRSIAISTKSEEEAELLYDKFFSETDSIRCGFVSAPTADEAPVIKRGTQLSGKMRI
jgi:hypothetical protein